jgi:hypothetical protein
LKLGEVSVNTPCALAGQVPHSAASATEAARIELWIETRNSMTPSLLFAFDGVSQKFIKFLALGFFDLGAAIGGAECTRQGFQIKAARSRPRDQGCEIGGAQPYYGPPCEDWA